MSISLTHSQIRAFAKSLRVLTGEGVTHSEIIEDIAASVGLRPDAMMHSLKKAPHRLPAFKEMSLDDAMKAMSAPLVHEKLRPSASTTDTAKRAVRDRLLKSILKSQNGRRVVLGADNPAKTLELSDDAVTAIARRLTRRAHGSTAVSVDQVKGSLSDVVSSGADCTISSDMSIAGMFANSGHTVVLKSHD